MGNTLQDIIAELEKVATSPVETPASEQPTEVPVENQVNENDELRKLAEEYDAAGRIMARAFASELEKIAVGATGVTPNTAAEGDNPAVQVSNSDVNLANVQQVVGVLKATTMGAEAKNTSQGQLQVDSMNTVATTPMENPPVAADIKQASADVVERLWQHYFGN
jgi:predicted RNA-binding protein